METLWIGLILAFICSVVTGLWTYNIGYRDGAQDATDEINEIILKAGP